MSLAGSSSDGLVTTREVRGWYVYDWANSPFWQVADILMKWLLKRLAEYAAEDGNFPSGLMSAGSYPAVVMWVTAALLVVCLLSFSAFGDFGARRKQLLRFLTFVGSGALGLTIFCFSPSMWWFAGLIRIVAGIGFVLSNTYYNAYLPVLTRSHHEMDGLVGQEAQRKEAQVSDKMSSKGMAIGYSGGCAAQLLVFGFLKLVECGVNCNEFQDVFWLCLCVACVGLWWSGFSLYTFRTLKTRAGPPMPEGTSMLCFGWAQAWHTLRVVFRLRQTLIFMLAYFIWSDALSTTQNVAALVLDDRPSNNSAKVLSSIMGTVAGIVGAYGLLKLQQCARMSNKVMLLLQLGLYTVVCIVARLTRLEGAMFYVCFAPVVLMMGSLQAQTRSLYASLSPTGLESAMFSLFAVTDKGSSLMGTAVIAGVHNYTGEYYDVLWYCASAFLVSGVLLLLVDVEQGMAAAKAPAAVEQSGASVKDVAAESPESDVAREQGTAGKQLEGA